MTQTGPWSVKGIDQRARDAARDAAREKGVTLGEYLNSLLLDANDEDVEDVAQPYQRDLPRQEAASQSLDSLTRRIEAAEARSTLAITGIDQSVLGLLARLEQSEDGHAAVAAHVDSVIEDIRSTHDALQQKVETLESDDTNERNLEALKSLEDALGKLAAHVYEENALAQDESAAVKGRIETGFADVNDRIDGIEDKVERTLTDAAQRVEKAVESAELRAEGTAKHLSDRLSALETDVASRLDGAEGVGEAIDEIRGDVTGALDSMEHTLVRIQERLNRAESTTDAALKSLESTFEVLDSKIDAVAQTVDPEAATELRTQFEARFEGLAGELRASVEATRAELAAEIERAAQAGVASDALDKIETGLSAVEARLDAADVHEEAVEARLAAVEAGKDTVETLARRVEAVETSSAVALENAVAEHKQAVQDQNETVEALSRRVEDVEAAGAEAIESATSTTEAVKAEFSRLSEAVDARFDEIESREARAIEQVGEEVGKVAETLHKQVAESEQRSAAAIEQIGSQVAAVGQRLQARQDDANRLLSEKVEEAGRRQDARLSEALAKVSDRLETMQQQASATLSPVQKAIASLATRLESLEDFAAPPMSAARGASAPIPTIPDFPDAPATSLHAEAEEDNSPFEAGLESWAVDRPPEARSPYDEDFGAALSGDAPEYVADLPEPPEDSAVDDPLSAFDAWDEAAHEARESEIFDTEPPAAGPPAAGPPVVEIASSDAPPPPAAEHEETGDYLARARAAARAAAENTASASPEKSKGKRSKKANSAEKPAKADKPAKASKAGADSGSKGGGRVPLYAAAGAVAIAAAGSTYYLSLRGKQASQAPTLTADRAEAPAAAPQLRAEAETPEIVADAPRAAPPAGAEGDETAQMTSLDGPESAAATAPAETPVSEPETAAQSAAQDRAVAASVAEALPISADAPAQFAAIPALFTLEQAAERGVASAQLLLGGDRLDAQDYETGVSLLRGAADQGQAAAQYRMAKLHEKGLGVPRYLPAARSWTEKAAAGGNVKAMHDLAVFYAEGEGGPQSYASAVEWFRKAAEFGVVDSQYNLGVLYEQGLGISPNLTEALFWFEIAAREGDPGAPAKIAELKARVSPEAAETASTRARAWLAKRPDAGANGSFQPGEWAAGTDHVIAVQTALAGLGYADIEVDGALGPATRDAIRAYQTEQGLPASGLIDNALVDNLNARAGSAARGSL